MTASIASEDRLDGKVALITGSSRGIGFDLARHFLQAGCRVMLTARTPQGLTAAYRMLKEMAPDVSCTVCDVSVQSQVAALTRATLSRFGAIDILINNAGVLGPIGPLWETDADAWQTAIAANLLGVYLCCSAVLPLMVRQRRGKIINLSGRGAASPWPRFSAYAASKAAVVRLTETLAEEVRPYNIQVNVMAPGANDTALFREAAHYEPEMLSDLPDDAHRPARLALFLASPRSDHITGKFIHVNEHWMEWTAADLEGDQRTLRRVCVPCPGSR